MRKHGDMILPRVVIVGAGFAGLWAARTLAARRVSVTLIDQNNYHLFLPLLYQVSAAEIEPEDIAYPVRTILRRIPNVSFDLAEVKKVAFRDRTVICEDHELTYDYLILATGSTSHFFGIAGAKEHSFPLKSMKEGIALRNHILCRFEHAVHESDDEALRRRLTFVVVGGGPTGVEFAGALAELIHGPLKKDFPSIDFGRVRIVLLEARTGLLGMLPESLQRYGLARLKKLGVEVMLDVSVSEVDPRSVSLRNGLRIPSETVVWTAGVRGNFFAETAGLPIRPDGRIDVLPTLQTEAYPNVYAAGDLAFCRVNGEPPALVAPVAISQGKWAARNILRQIDGNSPLPLRFRDKGTMVTIGRNSGVARIGRFDFRGFPAWVLWVLVHLAKLIGFRNRLLVLINWAWDYLFFERSVRLILPSDRDEEPCD